MLLVLQLLLLPGGRDTAHLAVTGPDFVGVQHSLVIHHLGTGRGLQDKQTAAREGARAA